MKNRKLSILFIAIFIVVILSFSLITRAEDASATFETDKNTRLTTVKITSDKKMNVVKFYKKAGNGKYTLFYISKPEAKTLECVLKSTFFSEEKETDKKFDKLPKMPSMDPKETAKPSWTPVPIPTKPTPSIHPSEAPAPSPSGSTNPSGGGDKITGIKLNKNSVSIKVGAKDKLTYTVTPEGAHPHLVWRTDANEICSIEADGTITGKSVGQAQISIKADNGVMDICDVTVTKEAPSPSANPSANPSDNPSSGSVDALRQKLADVALKEVGNSNGQKYLDYFNTNQAPGGWCSEFASWCAHQCGYVEKGIIPKKDGCDGFAEWFQKKGRFKDRNYVPKVGDICLMGGNNVSHTCIVVAVDEAKGKFYTVDGGSKVIKCTRTIKGSDIYGFGVPDYESIAN